MMEMLCFQFPGHEDTILKHMNSLRCRQHFCDITIVTSNSQTFKGHKVVLAACSPFLRDQFLLNTSSKLQVSMLYSSRVLCDLLTSCYTGTLQFKSEEIVNYLTAASYLQMDYIVEHCRRVLKKYMQLKNPSVPKVTSDDDQAQPLIVSRTSYSATCPSPAVGKHTPVQPYSPVLHSVEESNANVPAKESSLHEDNSPMLDEPCVKVNTSDKEEETRQEAYDAFEVYIPKEQETNRNREEERGTPAEEPQDASYPEANGVMIGGENIEYYLNPTEDDLGNGGFSLEGLHAFRYRQPDLRNSQGRGKSRGRGFKKRRLVSSQEKMSPMDHLQDLWYLATAGMGGSLGLDYSQEVQKPGGFFSVDLQRLDTSISDPEGEKVSPMSVSHLNQYSLEESNSGAGEGSSQLNLNEGVDESVAVVGSTSSVAGPIICEHCGMTFPSVHSLVIHSRATHLLPCCPFCGKHFNHAASLNLHMAVHRGVGKTHQCPLCYKTFTQKSTLIDHMNLHSGQRPHRCAYCHACFAHKPALRRHLKEQHGKTTVQNFMHEQEKGRAREAERGAQEEEQDSLVTEQGS